MLRKRVFTFCKNENHQKLSIFICKDEKRFENVKFAKTCQLKCNLNSQPNFADIQSQNWFLHLPWLEAKSRKNFFCYIWKKTFPDNPPMKKENVVIELMNKYKEKKRDNQLKARLERRKKLVRKKHTRVWVF